MEGLIEEAKEMIEEDASEEVLDAGLISKAQHVEHYEMAGYGQCPHLRAPARSGDQAELLQQTLDEEAQSGQAADADRGDLGELEAEEGSEEEEESTSRRGDRQVHAVGGDGGLHASRHGGSRGAASGSRGRRPRLAIPGALAALKATRGSLVRRAPRVIPAGLLRGPALRLTKDQTAM